MFVFRLLIPTVLEQGTENDGVGRESREEDVEGGDEGAELLLPKAVNDGGDLVACQCYAKNGEGHSQDNTNLSVFHMLARWKGLGQGKRTSYRF